MQVELTKEEQQVLLAALDLLVKNAKSSLQAANEVLPLAGKIAQAGEEKPAESQ